MDCQRKTRDRIADRLRLLKEAGHVRATIDRTLRPLGLNVTTYGILRIVSQNPKCTVQAMEADLGWFHGTTANVVRLLIDEGCLSKIRSENDGRVRLLHLTDQGHSLYLKATDKLEGVL